LEDKESGNPPQKKTYVEEKMLPELMDLVNKYQPLIIWADGDWEQNSEYWDSAKFLSWLYNESPVKDIVVTNDRWGNDCRGNKGGYWTPSDGYNPGKVIPHKWENCQTISTSWGYNRKEHLDQVKTAQQLIEELVSVVSYGGNYLLNLSPTSDGLIPIIQEERLKEIGAWLKINGEGIYSTRPWKLQQELSQKLYYTSKDNSVYFFFFHWPNSGIITLKELKKSSVEVKITFLFTKEVIKSKFENKGLEIYLPVLDINIAKQNGWGCKIEGIE